MRHLRVGLNQSAPCLLCLLVQLKKGGICWNRTSLKMWTRNLYLKKKACGHLSGINMIMKKVRTNNHLESYNAQINRFLLSPISNIFRFLRFIVFGDTASKRENRTIQKRIPWSKTLQKDRWSRSQPSVDWKTHVLSVTSIRRKFFRNEER